LILLSGFALGILAVLVAIIGRDFGHLAVGKGFVAILVAGSFFLIQPLLPDPWHSIASSISTMVPALFWLLCRLAFSYRPKILSFMGCIALYTFVAPSLARIFGVSSTHLEEWAYVAWVLPTYCEYLVILMGLWTVIAHWSDDLVESSRTLRGAVLISVGLSVICVVVPMNTGIVGMWLPYLSISIVAFVSAYFLLVGKTGVLFGVEQPIQSDAPAPIDLPAMDPELQANAKRLSDLMNSGFYRTEHLTLKALAEKLALPEYKTRALINQTLGYRNFNDYINQLRIHEACERLSNEPETPILNISLDVGYRTLSSFNRAFKDIKDTTPTAYRQSATQ
jgi:AraC-like DNA-binding protein